jgi:hypothetical protein
VIGTFDAQERIGMSRGTQIKKNVDMSAPNRTISRSLKGQHSMSGRKAPGKKTSSFVLKRSVYMHTSVPPLRIKSLPEAHFSSSFRLVDEDAFVRQLAASITQNAAIVDSMLAGNR